MERTMYIAERDLILWSLGLGAGWCQALLVFVFGHSLINGLVALVSYVYDLVMSFFVLGLPI